MSSALTVKQAKIRKIIIDGATQDLPLSSVDITSLFGEGATLNNITAVLTQLSRRDRHVHRNKIYPEASSHPIWHYWYDTSKINNWVERRDTARSDSAEATLDRRVPAGPKTLAPAPAPLPAALTHWKDRIKPIPTAQEVLPNTSFTRVTEDVGLLEHYGRKFIIATKDMKEI